MGGFVIILYSVLNCDVKKGGLPQSGPRHKNKATRKAAVLVRRQTLAKFPEIESIHLPPAHDSPNNIFELCV